MMGLKIPKLASGKSVFGKTPSRRPGRVIPQRGAIPDWAIDDYIDDAFDDTFSAALTVVRGPNIPAANRVMRGGRSRRDTPVKRVYRGGQLERQAQAVKAANRQGTREDLKAALNKRVAHLRKKKR